MVLSASNFKVPIKRGLCRRSLCIYMSFTICSDGAHAQAILPGSKELSFIIVAFNGLIARARIFWPEKNITRLHHSTCMAVCSNSSADTEYESAHYS